MLNFDNRGHLKPYESIPSSVDEMEEYFVGHIESETRKANFEKYIRYSMDLKKHSGGFDLKQWVDGSFYGLIGGGKGAFQSSLGISYSTISGLP